WGRGQGEGAALGKDARCKFRRSPIVNPMAVVVPRSDPHAAPRFGRGTAAMAGDPPFATDGLANNVTRGGGHARATPVTTTPGWRIYPLRELRGCQPFVTIDVYRSS